MRIDLVIVLTWWGRSVSIEGNRRRTVAGGDAAVGAWSAEAWSVTAIASSLGLLRLGSLAESWGRIALDRCGLVCSSLGRRGVVNGGLGRRGFVR